MALPANLSASERTPRGPARGGPASCVKSPLSAVMSAFPPGAPAYNGCSPGSFLLSPSGVCAGCPHCRGLRDTDRTGGSTLLELVFKKKIKKLVGGKNKSGNQALNQFAASLMTLSLAEGFEV